MVESLLKFITEQKLFRQEDQLLLAISGGIDSMVMAQLFLNAGIPFGLAHVNYNLRGKDSIQDCEFVKEWGRQHDIEVHVLEVDSSAYDSKESIQMVARRIRYEYFESLMSQYGYTRVATAHHLNDSFETVLLNLIKGTGPKGLRGIPLKNDYVIRPMMFASRADIKEYTETYNIKWREDSSNSKSDYQRNHIRHKVSPLLEEINPALLETYKDTQLRMQGAAELLAESVDQVKKDQLSEKADHQILSTGWVDTSNKSIWILSELMSGYGLNFKQVKDLHTCIIEAESGKIFESDQYIVNVDRGQLIIKSQNSSRGQQSVTIQKEDEIVEVGGKFLHLTLLTEKEPLNQGNDIALLDVDKLKWPLVLRKWEKGDWFIPLGMTGKKMISDFMIDTKIPVTLKEDVRLIESAEEIVWVVGHRLDDRFKITNETRNILKIAISDAEVL